MAWQAGIGIEQGTDWRIGEDGAANAGVVPVHIENADVILRLIRQQVWIPSESDVRGDTRIDPNIVLHISGRNVQAVGADLAIVLCERCRFADHEIG